MNISLPEALKAFVDEQVSRGGYGTSSEYVRALIRRDQAQTLNMTQRVTDPAPVYTLEELLQGITAKNRHEETPWGNLPVRATPAIGQTPSSTTMLPSSSH